MTGNFDNRVFLIGRLESGFEFVYMQKKEKIYSSAMLITRKSGIIDPASVAISAVTNALSIAGIVLTTECAIISKKEKQVVSEDNLI